MRREIAIPLIIVLVFMTVIGSCGLCGVVTILWLGKGTPTITVSEPQSVMSREEFQAAIIGRSKDDVIKTVGEPDVKQNINGQETWFFRNRTRDLATGRVDGFAQVVFRNGVVDHVNY